MSSCSSIVLTWKRINPCLFFCPVSSVTEDLGSNRNYDWKRSRHTGFNSLIDWMLHSIRKIQFYAKRYWYDGCFWIKLILVHVFRGINHQLGNWKLHSFGVQILGLVQDSWLTSCPLNHCLIYYSIQIYNFAELSKCVCWHKWSTIIPPIAHFVKIDLYVHLQPYYPI